MEKKIQVRGCLLPRDAYECPRCRGVAIFVKAGRGLYACLNCDHTEPAEADLPAYRPDAEDNS